MAIDFIYVAVIFALLLLILAFWMKNYPLVMLSSMFILLLGVNIAVNGIGDIQNTFLTNIISSIMIGVGAYIFVVASIEKMQEIETPFIKW